MQKERTIGTTTLKTPYIGMGTWAIGGGTWWGENDDALSIRTIEEAIDRGIVWFDTAPVSYTHLVAERTRSQVVQVIGKKIVLYKEGKDDKKKIVLP